MLQYLADDREVLDTSNHLRVTTADAVKLQHNALL